MTIFTFLIFCISSTLAAEPLLNQLSSTPESCFTVSEKGELVKFNYEKCPNLKSVIIPETVNGINITKIGEGAFGSRSSVAFQHFVIPKGVKEIGPNLFHTYLASNADIDHLHLPEGLEKIGARAFERLLLKSVNLPNSLKEIGEYAFSLNELKNIIIPSKIKVLEKYVFFHNELENVIISKGVEIIKEGAFNGEQIIGLSRTIYEGANEIKTLILPSTITYIGRDAFRANNLQELSLDLPNLKFIGRAAFFGNELSEVVLPKETIVERYAFDKEVIVVIK